MSDRITAAWILALLTITGFSVREIRKRRRDRAWAAGAAWQLHVADVKERLRIRDEEIALLNGWYEADSAEDRS